MAEYSPGWNDPPSLSYSQCNSSIGKRNVLNKRVPFPLNQSTASLDLDREKCNESLELSSTVVSSNVDINSISTKCKDLLGESNTTIKEDEILPFVIKTFENILLENSDSYEKKRIEEINQRLNIMKDSWDEKMSLPVKQKMLLLAQELSKGNAEAALKIQCILMVDYLREVKQWMVGVKHIIEMERQKVASSNVSSTSTD